MSTIAKRAELVKIRFAMVIDGVVLVKVRRLGSG